MSDDNKSGSDLDIFEGLGKKSAGRVSAAPPPPPGSANVAAAPPAPPPPPNSVPSGPSARAEMKRTLVGIPGPAQPPSQGSSSSAPSAPPPPPVSQGRISAPPPLPSQSGSMRAATPSTAPSSPSKPPPPPGRASLPNLSGTPSASTIPSAQTLPSMLTPLNGSNGAGSSQRISQAPPPPPPMSARPSTPPPLPSTNSSTPGSVASAIPTAPATNPSPAPNGGKLDMDWDDDNEATHVFDKDKPEDVEAYGAGPESRSPEHASMDDILSSPRPQPPAAGTPPPPPMQMPSSTSTLSGAFGSLGQARESNGAAAQFKSGAPPSQSLRSAPPPPPASMRNPSTSTAPIPPPPPPGQNVTAPMHMPMNGPGSMPPMIPQQSLAPQPSMPPPPSMPPQPSYLPTQNSQPVSQMPQMPPVSRAMEMTAVVPRNQSKAGLIVALIVGVFAAVAVGVFFLMPRNGTLVVNVADTKGGAVSGLDVEMDGKQVCTAAPCIVREVASGVHQVKVTATGFDAPAPRAITVESRKDSTLDFSLSGTGAAPASGAGTGLKASGNQAGVRLLVDGKEYGPLPQEIHDLASGDHKVRFVGSDRYQPLDKTVVVKQDEVQDLGNIQLKVLKGKATIQLGTAGAKVFLVNGPTRKEVPQFPIAIDFDPNEHWQLEAKMVGMDDYSSPISFDDGQAEKTITVTLNPKGTTPANTAPVTAQPPRTQPAVAWTPPAPKPAPPASDPAPAATKPDTSGGGSEAFLNINSKPASTVLLDGKPIGATPRLHVSVSPGTHTVLFVNAEESLKKSVSITVGAGETKPVIGKLRD